MDKGVSGLGMSRYVSSPAYHFMNILEEIHPIFDDIIDDYNLFDASIQEVSTSFDDYLIIDSNKNHNTYFFNNVNDKYRLNIIIPISDKDDQKLFDKWYLYHSSKKIAEEMFIIVNEKLYKDICLAKQRIESMGYKITVEYKKSKIMIVEGYFIKQPNTELFQVEIKVV